METILSRPNIMTVAGGYTLTTKYGSFRVEIGPLITGGDRFLDCQGVNLIAGSLKKQSLHRVNEELRETGFLDPTVPLPKHAAGENVGILVDIQDVQLDPVLIAVLPSGTGVYRCPFIDIWGSQIAFGGPHPSFTTPTANNPRSSMFTRLSTRPTESEMTTRRYRKNPRLCHLAPPGWGDSALGSD